MLIMLILVIPPYIHINKIYCILQTYAVLIKNKWKYLKKKEPWQFLFSKIPPSKNPKSAF